VANTPIWQLVILPAAPVYWRATPQEALPWFQKSSLIDNQNRVLIGKRFQRVLTYNVAQCVGIPPPSAQQRLLAPRTRIARCLGPHPAGLARLVAQQSVEKLPSRGRDPLLRKQRTHALLDISQGRSPQRQRVFNRRATNHQIPNHGHPWIQNFQSIATVMLVSFAGCNRIRPTDTFSCRKIRHVYHMVQLVSGTDRSMVWHRAQPLRLSIRSRVGKKLRDAKRRTFSKC